MTLIRGQDIQEAARWLMNGQLVAFPTETVYGLGANARDEQAIEAVYRAKGRPGNHPVIVHVAAAQDVSAWAVGIDERARLLMEHFWPGPLTLILPKRAEVSARITGGQDTVAVRCPAHPTAQALLHAFAQLWGPGAGVIAPSANRFGQVSPTQADHVFDEFVDVPHTSMYLLEGEAAQVGIESTIVDLSNAQQWPRILRPGQIQAQELSQVLGSPVYDFMAMPSDSRPLEQSTEPRVSGSLKAHYAPQTPLFLFSRHELTQITSVQSLPKEQRIACVSCGPWQRAEGVPGAVPAAISSSVVHVEELPCDPQRYAQLLYATLRRLDKQGYDALWFEQPPAHASWAGVNDRLRRAAAAFS